MLKILLFLCLAAVNHAEPTRILVAGWDGSSRVMGELASAFEAAQSAQGIHGRVLRSHGGSSRQARAVVDGLPADILAVSEEADLDSVAKEGILDKGWRQAFPDQAVPFGSAVVLVVRPGDPQGIGGWAGLTKTGVAIVMPNPFTSGSGRVDHLAALAWGRERSGFNDPDKERAYFKALYANILAFDSGSRGATLSFFERGLGDVLLTWESEAYLAMQRWPERGRLIWPEVTLVGQPRLGLPIRKHQSPEQAAMALAFARFLFTAPARAIAEANGFHDLTRWKAPAGTKLVWPSQLGDSETLAREQFGRGGLLEQVMARKR